MSHFEFDRTAHKIQLLDHANVALTPQFTAFNLVDSHSRGPWPDGTFVYRGYNAHAEVADSESEYGSHGILVFDVSGRTGMGVHSGRAHVPDALGRIGPQHCTLGCIRTTDEAMALFVEIVKRDPLESIRVTTAADRSAAGSGGAASLQSANIPAPRAQRARAGKRKPAGRGGRAPARAGKGKIARS